MICVRRPRNTLQTFLFARSIIFSVFCQNKQTFKAWRAALSGRRAKSRNCSSTEVSQICAPNLTRREDGRIPYCKLQEQCDPKPSIGKRTRSSCDIRRDWPRPNIVWRKCSGRYRCEGAQNLRHNESEAYMHTGQSLQKNHTEPDAL